MKEGKSTPREFEQQREVKLFLGMSAPELAEEKRLPKGNRKKDKF